MTDAIIWLVATLFLIWLIRVNIDYYRRRARMTPEERKAEDDELSSW